MPTEHLVPGYKALLDRCLLLRERALVRVFKRMLEYYWDMGCEINQALNHGRSEYGASTIARLSEDLNVSRTDLYNAMHLAAKFGRDELSPQLTWSHYRLLVAHEKGRARLLARQAAQREWSVRELRAEAGRFLDHERRERPISDPIKAIIVPLARIPEAGRLSIADIEKMQEDRIAQAEEHLKEARKRIEDLEHFIIKCKGLKKALKTRSGG